MFCILLFATIFTGFTYLVVNQCCNMLHEGCKPTICIPGILMYNDKLFWAREELIEMYKTKFATMYNTDLRDYNYIY